LSSQEEVANLSLNLGVDPSVVKIKDVIPGGVISQLGEKAPFLKNVDSSGSGAIIAFSSPQPGRGFKGEGNLAVVICEAVGSGEAEMTVASVTGNGPSGRAISFNSRGARIIVR
jgi:hypothetical protein